MKSNFLPITVLTIVCTTLPGTSGQGAQDSWDNLAQLRAGQKIEVVDMNLKLVKGEFVSFSDEAIVVRIDGSEEVIERAKVMRVSVRGDKRGRNALIGLAIGAAGGVALGAGIMERESGYGGAVAGTTALFAGIGAGVGSAFPGTSTIYRAQKREMASTR